MIDTSHRHLMAGDIVQFIYDPSNDNIAEHKEPHPCLVLGSYPSANEQTFVLLAPGILIDPVLPRPADVFAVDGDELAMLGKTPGILFDCPDRILVSSTHSRLIRQAEGSAVVCKLDSSQQNQIKNYVLLKSIFVDLSEDEQSKRIFEGQ